MTFAEFIDQVKAGTFHALGGGEKGGKLFTASELLPRTDIDGVTAEAYNLDLLDAELPWEEGRAKVEAALSGKTASVTAAASPDLVAPGDGEDTPPVPEGFGSDITDELRRVALRPKSSGALHELAPKLRNAKPDLTKTTDALAAGMLEATMRTLAGMRKPVKEGKP